MVQLNIRQAQAQMTIRFHDFAPLPFRTIRRGFGVSSDLYSEAFRATCHERMQSSGGGGGSGAFMFYTSNYHFVVKSITKAEREVLLSMLPEYMEYLQDHPDSHLTRFFGCHSIQMYHQTFSFVVMSNVIGDISMHQFYDIKGSWIHRHAEPIQHGQKLLCIYCNTYFESGDKSEKCEYTVHGNHMPRIVLKDNDFHICIRLPPLLSSALANQLKRDSDFLCKQGIMDYSLLLSVHYAKYDITREEEKKTTEATFSEFEEKISLSSKQVPYRLGVECSG